MSTSSLLKLGRVEIKNQPMVNTHKPPEPRFAPAVDPSKYSSFSEWLRDAVTVPGLTRSGLQARLAEFCGDETGPQHVTKWLAGSVPEIKRQKKIAAWAQVDYEKLHELADRQREAKQAVSRIPAGRKSKVRIKNRLKIV